MEKKTPEETSAGIEHALPFARVDFAKLGVVETAQGPMIPTAIRVRVADGSLKERSHMLMLLDPPRRYRAIKSARKWALEERWDLKDDVSIVQEMEEYERFALIIRDAKTPHDQSYPTGKALFEAFRSLGSLAEVKGNYDVWESLNDPRYGELNEQQAWAVINAIAKEGTVHPLMVIGGLEQTSCIVLSAKAALSSPRGKFWLQQQSTYRSGAEELQALELPTSTFSESLDSQTTESDDEHVSASP